METIEIDDLIALKLFDKAIKRINQLEGYDFYRYKAILYLEHSYSEESVSHAIEMWKFCDSPFQKLEYYLIRVLIFHQSHFKDRVQEFLQKFEANIKILYNDEFTYNIHLLIKYLEFKIELNNKDSIKRTHFIEELFKIAPRVVKYHYELLLLG